MANQLRNDIRKFILDWNKKFPVDFWWRQKYSIPFGSKEHREVSFIDMFIDYEETKLMNNIYKSQSFEIEEEDEVVGNSMNQEAIDDAFDNIDLSNYNNDKKQ